jgi:hypothetical protein
MDPYLEASWGDVHQALCTYSRDALQTQLGAGLVARMEERAVIEIAGEPVRRVIPDVRAVELEPFAGGGATATATAVEVEPTLAGMDDEPLNEAFIQVVDLATGGRVITVIEFLSPSNKLPGENRDKYVRKQRELLDGGVSLVEINLNRVGDWVATVPKHQVPAAQQTPYYAAVRRGYHRIAWEYYAMPLRQRLRKVRVPLRKGEPDAILDIQSLVDEAYEKGAYAKTIDYAKPCLPALADDDAAWAAALASGG